MFRGELFILTLSGRRVPPESASLRMSKHQKYRKKKRWFLYQCLEIEIFHIRIGTHDFYEVGGSCKEELGSVSRKTNL